MFGFLIEEGAITIGTLSGLFTTSLLNSFKANIVDPSFEKLAPSHILDKQAIQQEKSNFADLFPVPSGSSSIPLEQPKSSVIKWQTFLKDLITWIVIMFFLYLFWKKVLQPMKANKTI